MIFLLGLLTSFSVFAETKDILIQGLGSNPEDCHSKLAVVVSKLSEHTPVNVSYCKKTILDDFDGVVRIDKEFALTSKISWKTGLPYGSYKTMKECDEDLENQVSIFKTQTGLESVIIAYCKEFSKMTNLIYDTNILAIGSTETGYFHSSLSFDGRAYDTRAEFEASKEKISNYLMYAGLFASKISIGSNFFGQAITVGYYGQQKHFITLNTQGRFENHETCLQAKAQILALLDSNLYGDVFCGKSALSQNELHILTASPEPSGNSAFEILSQTSMFETRDTCEANLGSINGSIVSFCVIDSWTKKYTAVNFVAK